MTDEEIVHRLQTEEDFIFAPRYNNSVKDLVGRYPEGVPDRIIAAVLQIELTEVEEAYQRVLAKIREAVL